MTSRVLCLRQVVLMRQVLRGVVVVVVAVLQAGAGERVVRHYSACIVRRRRAVSVGPGRGDGVDRPTGRTDRGRRGQSGKRVKRSVVTTKRC